MHLVMPIVISFVMVFGLIRKVPVFECFTKGAKDGIKTIYNITPTLVGLIVAVTMLKESGALQIITDACAPFCESVGFPSELLPMTILRPVSGGGSTALLNQVLKDYGPDSFIGRCACVIAGSSETTFYAVTMYYSSVRIKKIRHTLFSALLADFTAAVFSIITVYLFF